VAFSVGGKPLAARAEDVAGVWPWTEAMPVPSLTPYVGAVLRREEDILPVFDLARLLMVQVSKASPLCLITRWPQGPMAVCIDPEVPTLHTVVAADVRPPSEARPGVVGVCTIGTDDVPIYSWTALGQALAAQAQQVA
jgi:chemotaxis signal transduction protein